MAIEVMISTENVDDFERNMISIRAEERLALVVKRSRRLHHRQPALSVEGPAGQPAGATSAIHQHQEHDPWPTR